MVTKSDVKLFMGIGLRTSYDGLQTDTETKWLMWQDIQSSKSDSMGEGGEVLSSLHLQL